MTVLRPLLLCGAAVVVSTFSIAAPPVPSLNEQLAAKAAQSKTPPETRKQMDRHIAEVGDSGIYEKAKKTGDRAPDFTLKNQVGEEVRLARLLENGPVALTWYRGGW